jgi:hypothetical protein
MRLIISSLDLWKITCICLYLRYKLSFPSFLSSTSSFSFQYLLVFLKSSRSFVLLLPIHFTSVMSPLMASWTRQFLLRIWPTQLNFLRRILFRSSLFSSTRSRTSSLVTFSSHFSSSILLQYHVSKLFKYIRSNFHSVQVSELFSALLQS